jgi:hypothetical protein
MSNFCVSRSGHHFSVLANFPPRLRTLSCLFPKRSGLQAHSRHFPDLRGKALTDLESVCRWRLSGWEEPEPRLGNEGGVPTLPADRYQSVSLPMYMQDSSRLASRDKSLVKMFHNMEIGNFEQKCF